MSVRLVYLDSSSIMKRYIGEKGSEVVDCVREPQCSAVLYIV